MSASETETLIVAPTLAPTTDAPLTPDEQFQRLQDELSQFPTAVDLVVAADEQASVGRSWAFDWSQHRFVKPQGALGPKVTFGVETLMEWVEKALHTAAGAHPVHPEGYGVADMRGPLYGAPVGTVPPDFEKRIGDALTFHPLIASVEDFVYTYEADDEYLAVGFTLVLSNGDSVQQDVRLAATV